MQSHLPDLVTPRLRLIAITPELLRADQAGGAEFGRLLACTIPANWPPVDWEPHVFDILFAQFERFPEQMAWHRYIALQQPEGARQLIGMTGAFWLEDKPAQCEVGYSVLPPFEGRGLATEAVQELIRLIAEDERIESVLAHTFPTLPGSIRVMEKCGMLPDGAGEEAGTIRYRRWLRGSATTL